MNTRYPFDFPEADPVYANNELGPHGYYPVGANNFWHGGIHLTETRPVIAVADGTAVAYRITEQNHSDRVQGRTVEYSNCFVLLKHEHVTPREQSITFYSLYMHLLPWGLYSDMQKRRPPVIFSAAGYEVTTQEDAPRGLNIRSAADGSIVTVAPCGSLVEVDSSPTNMATQGYYPQAQRRNGSHRKVFFTDHTGTRHTDCYALLDQTRARPENGKYRIITIEDPPTPEQRRALSGLRLRSAKNFDDSTIIRVMPRGTVIQAEPDDGKWYRVLDDNGETQGYTYNNNNLRQTTSVSVDPSPDVVTCAIPVKAGDILGFAGRYHGENILHLEIFTDDIGFMDNPKGDESRSSPVRIAAGATFKSLAAPQPQPGRRLAAGTRLRLVTDMALLNSPPYNDAREVSVQGATWWVKKSEMNYDWDNPYYTLKQVVERVYASNPEIEIPIVDCDATLAEERVVQRADTETMEYEDEEWLGIPLDGAPGGRAWISGNDPAVTPVNYFNWNEFFTKMTDTGDGYCDVREIIEKIEAVKGNEQDHLLHTREIRRAVREPTTARYLRSLVVQHPTEWSTKTDQSINRWEALWKYPFGERRQEVESEIVPHIQNLQWWDDAGLDELDPKTLWFFHPVRFLEHVGKIVGKRYHAEYTGTSLIVYTPEGRTMYEANEYGVVQFPESGRGISRYGLRDTYTYKAGVEAGKWGDNWATPEFAAAVYNAVQEYLDSDPARHSDVPLCYNDFSAYKPSHDLDHDTHDGGTDFDALYMDSDGSPIADYAQADVARMTAFVTILRQKGCTRIYVPGGSQFIAGTSHAPGHEDHIHAGWRP